MARTSRSHAGMGRRPEAGARAPWRLALIGLGLGLGLGLMALAPARWLAPWVAAHSPLRLVDAQGTIWRGSARLMLTAGPGSRDRTVVPDRIQWQTSLGGLDLQALCCMSEPLRLSMRLFDGPARLNVSDQRSLWPAEVLSGLGTPMNTLEPSGRLLVKTADLHWQWSPSGPQLGGQLIVELQNLGSALSTLRPMGHYRLALQGGAQPQLTLSTIEGALQLQGQGQWQGGRWRFTGQASTEPGLEPTLGNILNIIGRREGARSIISIG
jgi:general secretion pathway protein N